jgi:hypothetical protein
MWETGFPIDLVTEAFFLDPALLETLRGMLRTPRLQPCDAARQIRRGFGVEGIYVEDGSEGAGRARRKRARTNTGTRCRGSAEPFRCYGSHPSGRQATLAISDRIGMRSDPIPIRETEGGDCPECGRSGGTWGHGIPIEAAVAAVFADPGLLEPMRVHSCAGCGAARTWDVVTRADGRGGAGHVAVRRATLTAIRGQLALGRRPVDAADWIRRELGVVGVFVDDLSELGRRLGFG